VPRVTRQAIKAMAITCSGRKRVATGMDTRRPTVKASQKPEVR
jgi:hypothetical protein